MYGYQTKDERDRKVARFWERLNKDLREPDKVSFTQAQELARNFEIEMRMREPHAAN